MADLVEYKEDNPSTQFERKDMPLTWISVAYIVAFVLIVVSPLVLIIAFPDSVSDVNRNPRIAPPAPHLQINPAQDLARFRTHESSRLENYYWIDKSKGIVHIPIEQAMQKLVRSGAPGFPKAKP